MFAPPQSRPRPQPGVFNFIKSFYVDPMKWSLIKTWGVFAFGVYISKEICSIDFNSPPVAP